MSINQKTEQLIKDFEGLSLKAYYCAAKVRTIAWGHTGGFIPDTCTIEQAEAWLAEDIFEQGERPLNSLVHRKLDENQYGALVCLVFNVGQGLFARDSIRTKLLDGDYEGAAGDFWMLRRDKSIAQGGVILPGLQERRSAECHLFLTGEYVGRAGGRYKPGGDLFYGPVS